MRRKRTRTIYWLFVSAAALVAIFAPRLNGVQAVTAMAFVPVSHPANRLSHALTFSDEPLDPASPQAPRELKAIAEENERLRQRVTQLQADLDNLQQLHTDRQNLGKDIFPLSSAVSVVGGDGDVLQVLRTGRIELEPGLPVLHYGPVQAGVAGVITAAAGRAGQVRLISDPAIRVEGVFGRFEQDAFVTLPTEPPLIEGAGRGVCKIARMRREDIDSAGLAVGDWAVLEDPTWPAALRYYRVGQVSAIEDIADEPGFCRILITPAVELRRVEELMVFGERIKDES